MARPESKIRRSGVFFIRRRQQFDNFMTIEITFQNTTRVCDTFV